jgi:hypothetical protein
LGAQRDRIVAALQRSTPRDWTVRLERIEVAGRADAELEVTVVTIDLEEEADAGS